MRHTVRILMPCYNTAEFVGEAFASIVRQKPYCELFLSCVDDGSSEEQYERIRELFVSAGFEKGHAVLARLDRNVGLTGAWRECAKHFGECEYTTWLDSDDYYCRDDVFSDVSRLIDESSPDCIAFRTTDDEQPVDSPIKLAKRSIVWMCCKCVKTEFTPSFDGYDRIMNDIAPHMEICDRVNTVAYVDRRHFFYRDSPLSMCRGRLFGSTGTSAEILRTMACILERKYKRDFVSCARTVYVNDLVNTLLYRTSLAATHCSNGEKFVEVAVPYPSVECMPAQAVAEELEELHRTCVFDGGAVDRFIVPCGSRRAMESLESVLGSEDRPFKADVFLASLKSPNGTSAMFTMMAESVKRSLPQILAFIPPWWRPSRDVDLSRMSLPIDDSVFSVEMAGWPWSECGGYMNYFPRNGIMPGYVAVKSVHLRDRYVFNPSVPQLVNASKFIFWEKRDVKDEQKFLDEMNARTYYGQNDVDMVLVPSDTEPYFKDILGTDPAYRPVPEEKTEKTK